MIAMHHAIFGRRYGETIVINAVACTTFNMTMAYVGNITVDWGDGTSMSSASAGSPVGINFNKTYASPFTGTIKITGELDKVTFFQSFSNTGIYIDLKEFWKFTILNILELRGNCFINNSIAEIPIVTTTLHLINLPNLTMTGTAIDLPRVTTTLYLINLPNLTMTGTAIDLPRVTNQLFLQSLPNLTMTGTAIDLPRVTTGLNLAQLPNLTISGNAIDLPLSSDVLILSIGLTSLTYTALTTKPTTKSRTRIEISTKFTTSQTDEMLIDYATYSTTWNSPKQIQLSSLGRTTASDSAVATLNSRGVTITLL